MWMELTVTINNGNLIDTKELGFSQELVGRLIVAGLLGLFYSVIPSIAQLSGIGNESVIACEKVINK